MFSLRLSFKEVSYNFAKWKKNPRIIMVFVLAFVMCLMLSDRAISVAYSYGSTMQIMEAFIWTFGDANSILISSLLLVLLFADMPFISPDTQYHLVRCGRTNWLTGQLIYVCLATCIYLLFIVIVTAIICAPVSFTGNIWSETAAIIGYSGMGSSIALPASVKAMEMSSPYECAILVFVLVLLYMLFISCVMLTVNLKKGKFWGVLSAFIISIVGLFLNPEIIRAIFGFPDAVMYKANVIVGWISPLNHATYYMHNFGYDYLPRLYESILIFIAIIVILFLVSKIEIRRYSFSGNK